MDIDDSRQSMTFRYKESDHSMKILLVAVNAKYIHSCPAVYSLRACCMHPEIVEIVEFTINDRYQDILAGILEREADLIGFSTYIWNTDIVQDLAADIRRVRKDRVVLFAGGPEASYAPERFLGSCDFVICWEGERPFAQIVEYVNRPGVRSNAVAAETCVSDKNVTKQQIEDRTRHTDSKSVMQQEIQQGDRDREESLACIVSYVRTQVPGAAFYEQDRLIICPASAETDEDINAIPFLYNDLEAFDNRIIYYESSRGCPFNCTYCLSSIDKHVRFRNIETVLRELQYFIDWEVSQVKFIDRTFNCNHERTLTIWSYLRDHDKGITNFHFEIGADLLNESELALLETLRPGLIQLEIGIQSTNPDTLKAIRRTMHLPKLYDNINRLRRAQNINLHVDLIAGLPYEGFARFAQSFDDVYALHADQLQLGFLKVLSGTAMHAMAEEYDLRYSGRPPYEVLSTKWITYAELDQLRRICDVLEYYYNSRQFIHTLEYMEKYWEGAFAFFRELAKFFRERGYDKAKPAAARRYEVLEEFVSENDLWLTGTKDIVLGENNVWYDRETSKADSVLSENRDTCIDGGKCFDLSVFREYLRLDKAIHIHKSRRRNVYDEYDFGEGKVRITVDYERRNVLTGEAAYTVEAVE